MVLPLKIILYLAQGLALWACIAAWSKSRNTSEHYFLPFLLFVALGELTANLLYKQFDWINHVVYNTYDIVSFLFYIIWFYTILKSKKLVLIFGILYVIILGISLYLEPYTSVFLNINLYGGTIILLTLVFLFYASLLQKSKVIDFLRLPSFWIATGILIFHIGYLPIHFLTNIKGAYDYDQVQFIIMILNILMYGCIAKAFYERRRTK